MLFGLFSRRSEPMEVNVRREINFKIDSKMTEKDIQKQLTKILSNIEDETGFKFTVKKTYVVSLGKKLNGKSCNSFVAWIDFSSLTQGKEKVDQAQSRINFALNDINDSTNKYEIEYLN